jgi:biotin carboxyl carrier protein
MVENGQLLVIFEAMKMEHEVTAPEAGTVQAVLVEVGQQVDAGTVLVTVESGPADSGEATPNGTRKVR